MVDTEELFISLLNEFLLLSKTQESNPVKVLLNYNDNKLASKFKNTLSLVKNRIMSNKFLSDSHQQNFFLYLNTYLSLYYTENVSYFNYKTSIDKTLIQDYTSNMKFIDPNNKYYLINLDGFFLTPQNFQERKNLIFRRFVSQINRNIDVGSLKGLFKDENIFSLFTSTIDDILNDIKEIELIINNVYFKVPMILESSIIISNSEVIKRNLPLILKNSDQKNEWNEIYSTSLSKNSYQEELSLTNYYVDTKFFTANKTLIADLGFKIENIINFGLLDGLLIQSENFNGLRYLQENIKHKIDCIYIDPPYNTGSNDFLYNDDYSKKHWFWMLENRLQLAFDLLNDDGVLFISVDDNELVTTRTILDSIFDRFVGMYVWQKKTQPSFLNKELISVTEYILVYKKGLKSLKMKGGFTDPNKHTELLNISNDVCERILPEDNTKIYKNGKLFTGTIEKGVYGNHKLQVTLLNSITVEDGISSNKICLKGRFRWTQSKIDNIKNENRFIVIKSLKTLRPTVTGSGKKKIRPPITLLSKKINNIPTNTDGNFEMKHLFKVPPFYYPKPVNLIKFLIDSVTYNNKDALVLDFFAGSGTTGHAVINLNREDSGKRKFILIEEAEYFNTILVPRIKKCLYSDEWENGKPLLANTVQAKIKIIKLENILQK